MRVDVWSDVVCPWCYVGKRRFEAALARFEHRDAVELTWRSFELDPSAESSASLVEGQAAVRLAAKYGKSVPEAQQMLDQMTQVAAAEGLDFHLDKVRSGNTFDAHRLLHLALAHGVQSELKEKLDHETFTNGLSVSDHGELARLAISVGLTEADVMLVLNTDRFADAVRADEAQARAYGISGVPFFVVDGKLGVSGAQPSEQLLAVLTQAWSEREPDQVLARATEAGDACEGESCAM